MTTPYNPENGSETEGQRSIFDELPAEQEQNIPHSGEGVVTEYNTPLAKVDPKAHETPIDASTLPENLPSLDNIIVPPKEHRDSKLLPWYKKPAAKVAAGVLAIGAAFGGGAIAFGGAGEENKPEPQTGTQIEDTSTDLGVTTEPASIESEKTLIISDSDMYNPPLIENEAGFLIPSTEPKIYTIDGAPEIKQPASMAEAFDQISNIVTYTAATGDISYLEYVVGNVPSELAEGFLRHHDLVAYYEDVRGFSDFHSWHRISATENNSDNMPIGRIGESIELQIHSTLVGFDAFFEEYGPMYQVHGTQEAKMTFKRFETQDGSLVILPVFNYISPIDDLVFVDPNDMLNDDGTQNSRY